MRLTTMFLLATLALLGNLKNGFAQRYNQRGTFTVDFFAGIPSCPEVGGQRGDAALRPFLEGTPHALPHVCFQTIPAEFAPGELVNNLRGSVTVNFFSDTQIDGQLNAAWKSGGDAGFQFKNGFLKIEAAGDTEATFTLETTTDNFKMSDAEANKEAFSTSPGDTVWVVIPARVSAGPDQATVQINNPKDAYSTIFSLTSMVARQAADGIAEAGVNHDTIRGTVGQHGLAQANQAPNVASDVSDYRQHTQNIFLNNHPSESPELLQYMTFPVTFSNAV